MGVCFFSASKHKTISQEHSVQLKDSARARQRRKNTNIQRALSPPIPPPIPMFSEPPPCPCWGMLGRPMPPIPGRGIPMPIPMPIPGPPMPVEQTRSMNRFKSRPNKRSTERPIGSAERMMIFCRNVLFFSKPREPTRKKTENGATSTMDERRALATTDIQKDAVTPSHGTPCFFKVQLRLPTTSHCGSLTNQTIDCLLIKLHLHPPIKTHTSTNNGCISRETHPCEEGAYPLAFPGVVLPASPAVHRDTSLRPSWAREDPPYRADPADFRGPPFQAGGDRPYPGDADRPCRAGGVYLNQEEEVRPYLSAESRQFHSPIKHVANGRGGWK